MEELSERVEGTEWNPVEGLTEKVEDTEWKPGKGLEERGGRQLA